MPLAVFPNVTDVTEIQVILDYDGYKVNDR